MAICTSLLEVLDDMLIVSSDVLSGSRVCRYCVATVVLAVPLSPTKSTAPRMEAIESSSQVVRTVSAVGTTMEENLPPAGGT